MRWRCKACLSGLHVLRMRVPIQDGKGLFLSLSSRRVVTAHNVRTCLVTLTTRFSHLSNYTYLNSKRF